MFSRFKKSLLRKRIRSTFKNKCCAHTYFVWRNIFITNESRVFDINIFILFSEDISKHFCALKFNIRKKNRHNDILFDGH